MNTHTHEYIQCHVYTSIHWKYMYIYMPSIVHIVCCYWPFLPFQTQPGELSTTRRSLETPPLWEGAGWKMALHVHTHTTQYDIVMGML